MRALLVALVLVLPAAASAREVGDGDAGEARRADLATFELDLLALRESRARASTIVTENAMGSVHRGEVARVLHQESDEMARLGYELGLLDPGPGAIEARDAAIASTSTFAASFGMLLDCSRANDSATCAQADAAVAAAQAQLRDAGALLRAGSAFS